MRRCLDCIIRRVSYRNVNDVKNARGFMRDKSLLIIAACSVIIKIERRLARLKGPPQ